MKVAHLTTVDLSLRYLILPQLEAALEWGESIGISAPGEYTADLEERGIRHIGLESSTRGMNLVSDVRAMRQLWTILREEQPDILHTHNPKPGVYGRILGRMADVPIVVNTVHGLYATPDDTLLKRAIVYGLEAVASRFSDMELIQNSEDLDLLRRLHLVSSDKLRLLGNGVDLERFNPSKRALLRESARAALGLGAGEVAAGMVGRLVAEKGLPELIEAAEQVGQTVRVFVVGPHDPDKADALGDEMIERGRRAGIEFLGMRSDVESLYAAFDMFLLPSHREGFPRAAMEAAASGLPLVLTDIRGCRQVVEEKVNGFLVPVGEPPRLAEAIEKLAGDDRLRARMGEASADRAVRDFDESRVVKIVMASYRRLLEEKGFAWKLTSPPHEPELRPATSSDAAAVARLHMETIDTGFLSSLGVGFLRLLYRTLIKSDAGSVVVADADGVVVGFVAGTVDTGVFYREFIRRGFLGATIRLLPALTRVSTWRRIRETVRYGRSPEGTGVDAELLSMAVAPSARRLGLGSSLVAALQDWFEASGVVAAKVVVGAQNDSAISLYSRCGFDERREIQVHTGTPSLEMTWRS